ncbi:unnamed protein product, partial [Mesorhabditis belari]|uniref:Protein CLP1 homolog n=1 Tax=Mesorhabditis belari TaxID=2138241 RepID=A0AAF3EQ50_9BILA
METTSVSSSRIQKFELEEDNELRFVVSGREEVTLELINGSAEVFGSVVEKNKKYIFPPGARVAVFTWKKATVELIGTANAYVSPETPMIMYINLHAALEQLRRIADNPTEKDRVGQGPRIMLVGPTDVGKSTLSRILCNYAVRQNRSPIFVDLDVGQNSISAPGTIGAIHINRPADVVDGFERTKPIVYNYGSLQPGDNNALYEKLLITLSQAVSAKTVENVETGISGVIINTCGWIADGGYAAIVQAAQHFEVDIVAVLDQERLYNELQKTLPKFVKIVHLPKSGGVEVRSSEVRLKSRNMAVQRYFYGTRGEQYFPHQFDVPFDEVTVVKVGTESVPEECLPVGMKPEDYSAKVVPFPISPELRHHVLALSPFDSLTQEISTTPVFGFVVVKEVDMIEKKMTVLCPRNELPYPRIFVYTKIEFLDDHNVPM